MARWTLKYSDWNSRKSRPLPPPLLAEVEVELSGEIGIEAARDGRGG